MDKGTGHIVCLLGWSLLERNADGILGKKIKTLGKKKIFARWRCLKSGNILTPTERTPNELKPTKYLLYRVDQCWSDVLQQQAGFHRRAVPPSARHSGVTSTEPLNPALTSLGWQISLWEPGLKFRMPKEAAPSSLRDCHQYAHNSPLLELSWCHVCGCFTSSSIPGFRSVFRSLKDYVCIQNIEWCLTVQQKQVWGAGLEKRKHWLCVSHKFKIRIVSALGRTVSREVEHGRFDAWEDVSSVPSTVGTDEHWKVVFFLASCEKFCLDLGFCCLPWWVVLIIHDGRICVCVRWFCPRSFAIMRYFLSFSVCSFPIALMI